MNTRVIEIPHCQRVDESHQFDVGFVGTTDVRVLRDSKQIRKPPEERMEVWAQNGWILELPEKPQLQRIDRGCRIVLVCQMVIGTQWQ